MERYLLQWKSNALFWLFSLPSCHMSYFMSSRQLVTAAWRQFYPLASFGEGSCFLKLRSWVVRCPHNDTDERAHAAFGFGEDSSAAEAPEASGAHPDPRYCVLWTNYSSSSELYLSFSYLSWLFCLYLWILKNGQKCRSGGKTQDVLLGWYPCECTVF